MTLREAIEGAGGLANQSDLARRWGITRSTISEMVTGAGFPEPVTHVGSPPQPLWSIAECDEWRAERPTRRAA